MTREGRRLATGLGGVFRAAFRPVSMLVLAIVLAGCASSGESVSYDRNFISEEELRGLEERTQLLHAVQRQRPAWLRGRGQGRLHTADDPVMVYVNNQRAGGPEVLLRYTNSEVRELHFLDAIAATQRFGTGHSSGAIMVILR